MVEDITKKAFTLTEILIVMGVLAIISVIATSFFRGQILKGRDAKRKSDVKQISTVLEEYYADNECYPANGAVSCTPGDFLQPYLNKIACDPESNISYPYTAEVSTCPSWFRLFALLENKSDPDIVPEIGPSGEYNWTLASPNAPSL